MKKIYNSLGKITGHIIKRVRSQMDLLSSGLKEGYEESHPNYRKGICRACGQYEHINKCVLWNFCENCEALWLTTFYNMPKDKIEEGLNDFDTNFGNGNGKLVIAYGDWIAEMSKNN